MTGDREAQESSSLMVCRVGLLSRSGSECLAAISLGAEGREDDDWRFRGDIFSEDAFRLAW